MVECSELGRSSKTLQRSEIISVKRFALGLIVFFNIISADSFAHSDEPAVFLFKDVNGQEFIFISSHQIPKWKIKLLRQLLPKQEKPKLTAITLAVFLGAFGVHRLYLGTHPKVPVIYTLTLGGGFGILPLTDIAAIITAKDLEKYKNNEKVVMWINVKTEK